jgi:hypothetical protein
MAITVWAVNAVSNNPTYAGRQLRQTTTAPFLAGATTARPLGAFSGVRPGTPATTVTAPTSTSWSCAPHIGVIDGQTAAESGPYMYSVDAAVPGTITAANASNPRVDIIYAQVNDPAESDGSTTPGVTISYLAGQAGATPTAPATPARSIVLAQINVPKSGGGNPSVTWVAPYFAAAGGRPQVATVANLPAGGSTSRYDVYGDTAANNGTWSWNGTAWTQYATKGWVPFAASFSGTAGASLPRARYRIIDEECTVDILLQLGSSGGSFTDPQLTLPVQGTLPGADGVKGSATWTDVSAGGAGRYMAAMYTLGASLVRFGTWGSNGVVGAGAPFTTAAGDQLHCYFAYPTTS